MMIFLVITACSRPQEQGSTIAFIAGMVTLNGARAGIGDSVQNGSRILTGKNSGCDIMFNEKSIIRVRENADIVLYQARDYGSLDINSGTVLSFMKKTSTEEKSVFTIKTPTMVLSIHGTAFCIRVETADSTYLCDCNGTIEVHDSYMNEKRVLKAARHKAIRIKRGATRLWVTDAALENHTDNEMESLALKTGEILDWKRPDAAQP